MIYQLDSDGHTVDSGRFVVFSDGSQRLKHIRLCHPLFLNEKKNQLNVFGLV